MIDFILASENILFISAIGVMLAIGLMEGVGLLIGASISAMFDNFAIGDIDIIDVNANPDIDVDVDLPSPFFRLLGWLHVGKVPILILLVVFLTSFGLSGLVMQSVAQSITTLLMPSLLVAIPAGIFAFTVVRISGVALSALIPKDETEAISTSDFIGQVATVNQGRSKKDLPAEAKLRIRGQTHYVSVIPNNDEEEFNQGDRVLLVCRSGVNYKVIAPPSEVLQ